MFTFSIHVFIYYLIRTHVQNLPQRLELSISINLSVPLIKLCGKTSLYVPTFLRLWAADVHKAGSEPSVVIAAVRVRNRKLSEMRYLMKRPMDYHYRRPRDRIISRVPPLLLSVKHVAVVLITPHVLEMKNSAVGRNSLPNYTRAERQRPGRAKQTQCICFASHLPERCVAGWLFCFFSPFLFSVAHRVAGNH